MKTTPKHQAAYDDLVGVLKKHGSELSAVEMLALASKIVGRLVAMQDQRTMTPQKAMQVVATNVELGNAEMLESMMDSKGAA